MSAMKPVKRGRQMSKNYVLRINRRVLRFVDSFIENCCPSDTLVSNKRGTLATWEEVRQHIAGALKLRTGGR